MKKLFPALAAAAIAAACQVAMAQTAPEPGSAASCACFTGGTHCVQVRTRVREVIADLDARLPLRFVEVSPDDSRHKILYRWGGTDPDSNPPGRAEVGYMDDIWDNYQHVTFRKGHVAEDPEVEGDGAYNLQPNVGTTPAVHLIITSPARHDELLTALSKLADPHAPGAMDEICRVYNQKIVGEARRGPVA